MMYCDDVTTLKCSHKDCEKTAAWRIDKIFVSGTAFHAVLCVEHMKQQILFCYPASKCDITITNLNNRNTNVCS